MGRVRHRTTSSLPSQQTKRKTRAFTSKMLKLHPLSAEALSYIYQVSTKIISSQRSPLSESNTKGSVGVLTSINRIF